MGQAGLVFTQRSLTGSVDLRAGEHYAISLTSGTSRSDKLFTVTPPHWKIKILRDIGTVGGHSEHLAETQKFQK